MPGAGLLQLCRNPVEMSAVAGKISLTPCVSVSNCLYNSLLRHVVT